MDQICQTEKLKIDTLESKLRQITIEYHNMSKEIILQEKKLEDSKKNKQEEVVTSNEEILSLKYHLQNLQKQSDDSCKVINEIQIQLKT